MDRQCADAIKRALQIGRTRPPIAPGDGDTMLQAVLHSLERMLAADALPPAQRGGDWTTGLFRQATDDTRMLNGEFERALEEVANCWDDRAEADGSMSARLRETRNYLRRIGFLAST